MTAILGNWSVNNCQQPDGLSTCGYRHWGLQVFIYGVFHKSYANICLAGRGIGLAVTNILLTEFGAVVAALSRTKTLELSELEAKHSALLFSECDVSVLT